MINITIAENGVPSSEMIKLGNESENLDEVIQFTFPTDLEPLHKYVVAKTYDPKKKENITRVTPLVNNRFVVGSAITKVTGTWLLYTLCKSYAVDEEGNITNTERVSISDPITAVVNENDIDIGAIEKVELDPNIKIIYDELISFKKELESNEATRQENETTRANAENGRLRAETVRKANESERVSAEQLRVEAEAERKANEIKRQSNESARIEAETERKQAEVARCTEENKRAEAENTRSSNEQARINAESERTKYETLRRQSEGIRLSNEENRSNAEKSRIHSEQERINAEATRINNEQSRINAESQRVAYESDRAKAETARAEAENTRATNEQTRINNEASRVSAESDRAKAETVRQEAEANREGTINKIREDVDTNTKNIGITERSLSALWDLNKGISYRFENDNEKAYMKTVPSGAKLGAVNSIGGKTIVYNQLFTEEATTGSSGITATYADGVVTLNGTTSNYYVNFSKMTSAMNVVAKFYIKMTMIKNDDDLSFGYGWLERSMHTDFITSSSTSTIYSQTSSDLEKGLSTGISWAENIGSVTFNDVKIQITIVNLTKMFGEGNEPSTVEEFESMFPNSHYPYNEGELMSISVNDVVYTDTSSSQVSYQIPQAILDLDGYGWGIGNVSNYVDYENKKFYKYVNGVDLGTFTEIYVYSGITPSDGRYVYAVNISEAMVKDGSSAICELFNSISYDDLTSKDGMFLNVAYNQLLISTNKCKSVEELKAYINNKYLYYELAEPIVTDISNIIGDTFQEPFNVESGGSLTFKNKNGDGYQVAVPSDVQYVVSLKEVA